MEENKVTKRNKGCGRAMNRGTGKEWMAILNRIVREDITMKEVRKQYVDIWCIRMDHGWCVPGAAGKPVTDMECLKGRTGGDEVIGVMEHYIM